MLNSLKLNVDDSISYTLRHEHGLSRTNTKSLIAMLATKLLSITFTTTTTNTAFLVEQALNRLSSCSV